MICQDFRAEIDIKAVWMTGKPVLISARLSDELKCLRYKEEFKTVEDQHALDHYIEKFENVIDGQEAFDKLWDAFYDWCEHAKVWVLCR